MAGSWWESGSWPRFAGPAVDRPCSNLLSPLPPIAVLRPFAQRKDPIEDGLRTGHGPAARPGARAPGHAEARGLAPRPRPRLRGPARAAQAVLQRAVQPDLHAHRVRHRAQARAQEEAARRRDFQNCAPSRARVPSAQGHAGHRRAGSQGPRARGGRRSPWQAVLRHGLRPRTRAQRHPPPFPLQGGPQESLPQLRRDHRGPPHRRSRQGRAARAAGVRPPRELLQAAVQDVAPHREGAGRHQVPRRPRCPRAPAPRPDHGLAGEARDRGRGVRRARGHPHRQRHVPPLGTASGRRARLGAGDAGAPARGPGDGAGALLHPVRRAVRGDGEERARRVGPGGARDPAVRGAGGCVLQKGREDQAQRSRLGTSPGLELLQVRHRLPRHFCPLRRRPGGGNGSGWGRVVDRAQCGAGYRSHEEGGREGGKGQALVGAPPGGLVVADGSIAYRHQREVCQSHIRPLRPSVATEDLPLYSFAPCLSILTTSFPNCFPSLISSNAPSNASRPSHTPLTSGRIPVSLISFVMARNSALFPIREPRSWHALNQMYGMVMVELDPATAP